MGEKNLRNKIGLYNQRQNIINTLLEAEIKNEKEHNRIVIDLLKQSIEEYYFMEDIKRKKYNTAMFNVSWKEEEEGNNSNSIYI